jgi:hypothetical protein
MTPGPVTVARRAAPSRHLALGHRRFSHTASEQVVPRA